MKLIINKKELQMLILWGSIAEIQAEDTGIPFQEDELKLLAKLRT